MRCSCCDGSEGVVRALKTNGTLGYAAGKRFGNSHIVADRGTYRILLDDEENE